jgi:hypothetical protein
MNNLNDFSKQFLKDAARIPGGRFDFIQTVDRCWHTPYGKKADPHECKEIEQSVYELRAYGFIQELVPNGCRFAITELGYDVTKRLFGEIG